MHIWNCCEKKIHSRINNARELREAGFAELYYLPESHSLQGVRYCAARRLGHGVRYSGKSIDIIEVTVTAKSRIMLSSHLVHQSSPPMLVSPRTGFQVFRSVVSSFSLTFLPQTLCWFGVCYDPMSVSLYLSVCPSVTSMQTVIYTVKSWYLGNNARQRWCYCRLITGSEW